MLADSPTSPKDAAYIIMVSEMKLDIGGAGSAKGVDPLHQVPQIRVYYL